VERELEPLLRDLERDPKDIELRVRTYTALLRAGRVAQQGIEVAASLGCPAARRLAPDASREREDITGLSLASLKGLPVHFLNLDNCNVSAPVDRKGRLPRSGLAKLVDLPLRSLSLQETKVSAGDLAHLLDMPALEKLDLSYCMGVGDRELALLAGLKLKSLGISPTKRHDIRSPREITDAGLVHLANMPLEELDLSMLRITDEALARLAHFPLKALDLGDCKNITDRGLRHLSGISTLRDLSLMNCPITDAGLVHLTKLPLEELNLGAQISSAGIARLADLPLRWLSGPFLAPPDADRAAAHLRGSTTLEFLWIGYLTDTGVSHLADMPLRRLSLSEHVTDAGLRHLRGMSLEELSLDRCKITDAGLKNVEGMPLTQLRISGCRITDAALDHLQGLPLRYLNMEYCTGISLAAVERFAGSGLEFLKLGRMASEEEQARLQSLLPGCTLQFGSRWDQYRGGSDDLPERYFED
jgi:Leucine Rich repeat